MSLCIYVFKLRRWGVSYEDKSILGKQTAWLEEIGGKESWGEEVDHGQREGGACRVTLAREQKVSTTERVEIDSLYYLQEDTASVVSIYFGTEFKEGPEK